MAQAPIQEFELRELTDIIMKAKTISLLKSVEAKLKEMKSLPGKYYDEYLISLDGLISANKEKMKEIKKEIITKQILKIDSANMAELQQIKSMLIEKNTEIKFLNQPDDLYTSKDIDDLLGLVDRREKLLNDPDYLEQRFKNLLGKLGVRQSFGGRKRKSTRKVKKSVRKVKKSVRKVKKSVRKVKKSVRKSTRKVKKSVRKSPRKVKKSVRKSPRKIKKSVRKSVKKSAKKTVRKLKARH